MPATLQQEETTTHRPHRLRRIAKDRESGEIEGSSIPRETQSAPEERAKKLPVGELLAKTSIMAPLTAAREIYPEDDAVLIIDQKTTGVTDFAGAVLNHDPLLGALLIKIIQENDDDALFRAGVPQDEFVRRVMGIYEKVTLPSLKEKIVALHENSGTLGEQIQNMAYIKGVVSIPIALHDSMRFAESHEKAELIVNAIRDNKTHEALLASDQAIFDQLFFETRQAPLAQPATPQIDLETLARDSIAAEVFASYEDSIKKTNDYSEKKQIDDARTEELSARSDPGWTTFTASIQSMFFGSICYGATIFMLQNGFNGFMGSLAIFTGLTAGHYISEFFSGLGYRDELEKRVEKLENDPQYRRKVQKSLIIQS